MGIFKAAKDLFTRDIERELTPKVEQYLFYADVRYRGENKPFLIEAPSQEIAARFLKQDIVEWSAKIIGRVPYSYADTTHHNLADGYPELRQAMMDHCNAIERKKPLKDRKIVIAKYTPQSKVDGLLNDIVDTKIISLRPIGGSELTELIDKRVEFLKIFSVSPDMVGILSSKTLNMNAHVPFSFKKYETMPLFRTPSAAPPSVAAEDWNR